MEEDRQHALADFSGLTPHVVIDLVEGALGRRCTNLCRPLNSYINRVYEVELEEGGWAIAKFYRPGRWSREALQDEQDFVSELAAQEIPVVAPLACVDGKVLQEHDGMCFALFPKKGGRPCDEPSLRERVSLGRLLARVHAVGSVHPPRDRIEIDPQKWTGAQLDCLLSSGLIPAPARAEYEATARRIIETITPLFDGVAKQRIHGDCHPGNILYRPGEPFHVIDFDDMAVGPPVQDLWMLLPDHLKNCRPELEALLEGYETFHDFDRGTLKLIEPLRAMRFIHFTAWCARQKADGGFARLAPDWGTTAFWRQEIHDLEKQYQEIEDALGEMTND